jgi:hypothetical protein
MTSKAHCATLRAALGPEYRHRRERGLAGADCCAAIVVGGNDRQRIAERRRANRYDRRRRRSDRLQGTEILDGDRHVSVGGDIGGEQDHRAPGDVLRDRQNPRIRRKGPEWPRPAGERQGHRLARIGNCSVGLNRHRALEDVVRRTASAPATAECEHSGNCREAGQRAQPAGEMADFRHDGIPDDVVLKMAGWQCCFGCCNKHLAHSLEIKA